MADKPPEMATSALFLATPPDADAPTILVYRDEQALMYRYDRATRSLERDDWLYHDYLYDHWATYSGVTVAEAKAWVARQSAQRPQPSGDNSVPLSTVIEGLVDSFAGTRGEATAVTVEADQADGAWVTYKVYPADKRSTARSAASQIRSGKVKAVPPDRYDATVDRSDDDEYVVMIRARTGTT